MRYLREFADSPYKDDEIHYTKEDKQTDWSKTQENYINKLKDSNDADCVKYFDSGMSLAKFEIIHQSYKIGAEYAEQLAKADLDDEMSKVVLFGYSNEINVIHEAVEGESPDNLKMLIELLSKRPETISEIFDENKEFIDYKKVQSLLTEM